MDPLLYWKSFKPMDEFLYNWLETTCILLGAIGFMLNIFVINFLLSTKRTFKVTSNRYLLINLALSDILRLVSSVPLKLISSIYKQWIFGDLGCQIYGFIGGFAGFLSTSTLAIMAIERYFMIKNPLIAFKNRKKLIIIIIISSWIYSLFCASIQLFSKRGFVLEGMLTSCTFDYLSGDLKSRLIICSIVLGGFIIPFVVLVSFYSLALKTLKAKVEYFKSVSNVEKLISSTSTSSPAIRRRNAIKIPPELSTISANMTPTSRTFIQTLMLKKSPNKMKITMKFSKREFLVTKAVITFVAIFLLSWMPYIMIVIVAQIGINIENYVTPFTVALPCLFAKSSTILNPLIYTLINPECKAHFKRLFFRSIKVYNL